MLPKANRLSNGELAKVKEEGKMQKSGEVAFLFTVVPEEGVKAGIVVSSRVARRATERNRIKRKLREAVRELVPLLKKGSRVVILSRRKVLFIDYRKLVSDLRQAFLEAGLVDRRD